MFLVTVTIERTAQLPSPALDADLLARAIRAEAAPGDGLEHVSTRAGPDRTQVGLFCLTDSRENAETMALRICRKALEHQPRFSGWRLAEHHS